MLRTVTIKPVDGRVILQPELGFRPLPAEGAVVEMNAFYVKAINDGDVAVYVEPKPVPAKPVVKSDPLAVEKK